MEPGPTFAASDVTFQGNEWAPLVMSSASGITHVLEDVSVLDNRLTTSGSAYAPIVVFGSTGGLVVVRGRFLSAGNSATSTSISSGSMLVDSGVSVTFEGPGAAVFR